MIRALDAAMQQHGYALVSAAFPPEYDGIVVRFVVAGDDVLAERLRPIVVEVSGLEIMMAMDPHKLAIEKAAAAIDAATGRR